MYVLGYYGRNENAFILISEIRHDSTEQGFLADLNVNKQGYIFSSTTPQVLFALVQLRAAAVVHHSCQRFACRCYVISRMFPFNWGNARHLNMALYAILPRGFQCANVDGWIAQGMQSKGCWGERDKCNATVSFQLLVVCCAVALSY